MRVHMQPSCRAVVTNTDIHTKTRTTSIALQQHSCMYCGYNKNANIQKRKMRLLHPDAAAGTAADGNRAIQGVRGTDEGKGVCALGLTESELLSRW